MRRFVIGVSSVTPDQEKAIQEYLGSLGGWWHWISNMWLLASNSDSSELSASRIAGMIIVLAPESRAVVFEFPEDINWALYGKTKEERERMGAWLRSSWMGKED